MQLKNKILNTRKGIVVAKKLKDIYCFLCNKCRAKTGSQLIKELKDYCPECRKKVKPIYDSVLEILNNDK